MPRLHAEDMYTIQQRPHNGSECPVGLILVAPLHCASAAEAGEAEDERKNTAAVLTMMFGVCVNRIGDDAPLRDAPRATQLADLGQRLRRQSRAELRIAGSLLAVRSSGRTAARGVAAVQAR
jgi:hypothetical protein